MSMIWFRVSKIGKLNISQVNSACWNLELQVILDNCICHILFLLSSTSCQQQSQSK